MAQQLRIHTSAEHNGAQSPTGWCFVCFYVFYLIYLDTQSTNTTFDDSPNQGRQQGRLKCKAPTVKLTQLPVVTDIHTHAAMCELN